jgi:hypothetical protein
MRTVSVAVLLVSLGCLVASRAGDQLVNEGRIMLLGLRVVPLLVVVLLRGIV